MELRAMIGEAVPPRFTRLHGEVLMNLLGESSGDLSAIELTDPRCKRARDALRTS